MRFSRVKKNTAFQKSYVLVGVKNLLRAGMMSARLWGVHAVVMSRTERLKIEKANGSCCGQKEYDLLVLVDGHTRLRS